MEPGFWHQRWREGRTGFHLPVVNPKLERFWPALELAPECPVFVPLCGKSLDLPWLARHHPVTGSELSPIAVEEFFARLGRPPARTHEGGQEVCSSGRIRILCGDFFSLTPGHLWQEPPGHCAVYDRAALVALPPDMRVAYIRKLESLLPPSADMLLVTLDYPQTQREGPPFAVSDDEVRQHFGAAWQIRLLDVEDRLQAEARFREQGVTRFEERVYHLRRTPPVIPA
ncbi:MAG TPA: thiopurine S-methyltransferase [Gammaproteobacteria bacterium]|nr:thiopurine S-methyltransferase [Gammaproteobacteria bacterium]